MLADNKEGGNKKGKELEKEGLDRILDLLQKAKDDKNSDKPPIYEPGPYPYRLLSCLPYLVPIADSFDLGKYCVKPSTFLDIGFWAGCFLPS